MMQTSMATRQYARRVLVRRLLVLSTGLAACTSGTLRPATGRPRPVASGSGAAEPVPSRLPTTPPPAAPVELVWQADAGPDRLRLPTGLAVDRDGTVTVVDAGNNRLVRLASSGQLLACLGYPGRAPGAFGFASPPDPERGGFGHVGGSVAVAADGALLVADPGNARIQQFDRDGRFVTAWDAGPVPERRLVDPSAIAIDDRRGRVYVADRVTHRLHAFDRAGRWLLAWGEPGQAVGQFITPVAVAVDRSGRVYVVDHGNDRLQVFDSAGRLLTAWGGRGSEAGGFEHPIGVAVDVADRVYVVGAHGVQVFSATGVWLAAWNGAGAGREPVAMLGGIAVDEQGAIYLSDQGRARVVKVRPREPWPTPGAAVPTPWPPTPTSTPVPALTPLALPVMTPTDR